MTAWPADRVDTLTAEWARGYSASTIAAHIGTTRNAVLGKVHRLGLPARVAPSTQERVARRTTYLRQYNVARRGIPIMSPKVGPPPTPVQPPFPRNLSILELKLTDCHWPVTDRYPHFFCGHPIVETFSYCPFHLRLSRNHGGRA